MKTKNPMASWCLLALSTLEFLLAACAEGPLPKTTSLVQKWVGPLVNAPGGGQFRTVIYFGPWQCSQQLMNYCRGKCAGDGYALQGCMWLADVKMDFQGTLVRAGSRFGMTHCCCNYATLNPAQTEAARSRWNNIRTDFREQWAGRFGAWPTDTNGRLYEGHHVRDLWHGGNPTDWENILPFPKAIHQELFGLYNQCYANNPPWSSVGPDYPYGK
ncbi:hypothetical protein [Myxococcus eversor]|uniref:hypothetical protein n=1 Tax=Myxococcus eversor TaxID=2709661 RepID=UPI001F07AA83|nr:hypothetical protein [Myxococcus eversor]